MDYGKILAKGFFGWSKNKDVLKDGMFIVIISILVSVILLGIGISFFGSIDAYLQSGAAESDTVVLDEPLSLTGPLTSYLSIAFIFGVILFFVFAFFTGRIMRQALLQNRSAVPFDFSKGIKLAILMIVSFLIALFSWYNKKWLLVLLLAVIGIILLSLGLLYINMVLILIGLLLAVVCGIIYAIIFIYNSVRLVLAEVIFVEKEQPILDSLKESWKMSYKKVFRLFLAEILVGIALLVVVLVISIPSGIISIATVFSPEFLIAAFVVSLITNAIVKAVSVWVSGFALIELYEQILAEPLAETSNN